MTFVPPTLPLKLPSAIAVQFGVSVSAVRKAMSDGRLPYCIADGANSRVLLVDPVDAAKVWGHLIE